MGFIYIGNNVTGGGERGHGRTIVRQTVRVASVNVDNGRTGPANSLYHFF